MTWHFIMLITLLVAGCEKESTHPTEGMVMEKSYTYLALGDSYTIGQSVEEEGRWPVQLVEKLDSVDITIDSLKIIAQTGWTTANLQNAIDQEEELEFDLVSLLIGVNNQYQGLDFNQFQVEFDSLLQQAIQFVGTKDRVFVVSIPDYGVTPFGAGNSATIAAELDAYNNYMLQECEEQMIPFIDITEISRELGNDAGALAPDNLHPSAYQYSLWVEEILPHIQEMFD